MRLTDILAEDKGLGDTVKRVIDKTGIKVGDCGCKKRQEQLNKFLAYKNRKQGT